MTKRSVVSLTLLAAAISGCAQLPPISSAEYVPASSIMNGLKCELGRYVGNNPGTPITGWNLVGILELRIAEEAGSSGGAKADSIVAFQPAALSFDFGTGLTRKRTRNAILEFRLDGKSGMSACLADENGEFYFVDSETGLPDKRQVLQGIGLEQWLEAFKGITPHGPVHNPTKYSYALSFAVATQASLGLGAKLTVVPIALSSSNYAKREDIQLLTMTFAPKPTQQKADPIEIRILSDARKDPPKDGEPKFAPFTERSAPSQGPASVAAPARPVPLRIPEETRRELETARDRLFTN